MIKKNIILIGGGGHCKSVIDIIEQEDLYNIVGIIDKKELIGKEILGYKVIGCDGDLCNFYETCKYAIVTIGQIKSNNLRIKLFDKLKEIGYILPIVKSPLAYISKHSKIDEGTVIMHNVIINAGAEIGKNCIINTKALIEHDVVVKDNCHISTGVVVNGGVVVQKDSFIGSNAVTKEYIEISGFIKAGSVAR